MAGLLRAMFQGYSWMIFVYLIFIFVHACSEMNNGIKANSLALMSNAFHEFCDCMGVLVGWVASGIIQADWGPNIKYTYGYGRADAVGGMISASFLTFVTFVICGEAAQRMVNPVPIKTDDILRSSSAGMMVNLVGILLIYFNGTKHEMERRRRDLAIDVVLGDDDADEQEIRRGMMWHATSSFLGSAGVIASAYMIENNGASWHTADPICALVISVIILFGIMPLMKQSIAATMQRSPPKLDKVLPGLLEQILRLHNVHKVNEPHFWVYHAGYYVASLRLVLENVVTSQKERLTLIWAVREYLKERGFKRTTIEFQLKNDPPYNWETADPTPLPPEVLDMLGRDWDASKPIPDVTGKRISELPQQTHSKPSFSDFVTSFSSYSE